MLATDQKPVEILNELIVINNDRMEGYDYAAKEADVSVLKDLFSRLTETSACCKKELMNEVYKLGGTPADGINSGGDMQKAWEEVKNALIYKDHLTLLKSCNLEETVVIKSYAEALQNENENITTQHQQLFYRQFDLLHADHIKVKNLLSVLMKAC